MFRRKMLIFLLTLGVLASPLYLALRPAQAAPAQLSMMSWNIQGSKINTNDYYGGLALTDIPNYIKSRGVEYVNLQEVSADHARQIAVNLGWGTDASHLRTAYEHGGEAGVVYSEGIAIISKYPITAYNAYDILPPGLPYDGDGRGRKLQRVVVNDNGTIYHLYNTHLASNDWTCGILCGSNPLGYDDDDARAEQAKFVRDKVTQLESSATDGAYAYALGGDMNSHPQLTVNYDRASQAYTVLRDSFTDTWLNKNPSANNFIGSPPCASYSGCTVSIRNASKVAQAPTVRIDYFFVKRGSESLIRSVYTPAPTANAQLAALSDHFPYQAALGPAPLQSPVAKASYSRLTGTGNRVTLNGSTSYDPDGSITNWTWKNGATVIATGATPTVSMGSATSTNVTLTVTDNQGLTGSTTITVSTPNRTPVINSSSPASGSISSTNTPTLSASTKDDDGDALSYYFHVTGPLVDINSGWIGSNSWKVPASRLDPGTNYTWTVQARDPKLAYTATLTKNFTVAMLPTANELVSVSTGDGYWEVAGDGGVFSYGSAQFYGSVPGLQISVNNIIGMARTPTDHGYWVVGKDGGVFAFGDAQFYGSLPSLHVPVGNIVGMAPTKNGQGYWLVGSDGGVFAFGNAGFYGSMGGQPLNKPVQAIAPTATSQGYWLAAEDGGVFAFGDAPFYGSMGGQPLNYPVVDIDATPDGKGYWMAAQDGGIFAFGNAGFFGSMAGQPLNGHINSMSITPDGKGYWLNGCDGGIFAFGNAPFYGSQPRYACRGISY